jgi:predicted enzyme related to lactoylglutathione lyase
MKLLSTISLLVLSVLSEAQDKKPIVIESLFQVILNVMSMEDQVVFYRDVLGLKIIYPAQIKNISTENFVRFETGGANLVLHLGRESGNAGQEPRLSFKVTDLTSSRDFLISKRIIVGPIRNPAPNVFVIDCKDPEGNTFHLESSSLQ